MQKVKGRKKGSGQLGSEESSAMSHCTNLPQNRVQTTAYVANIHDLRKIIESFRLLITASRVL